MDEERLLIIGGSCRPFHAQDVVQNEDGGGAVQIMGRADQLRDFVKRRQLDGSWCASLLYFPAFCFGGWSFSPLSTLSSVSQCNQTIRCQFEFLS
jgi:hypothetical protein